MRYQGLCLVVVCLSGQTAIWSDEPVRPKGVVKQRVDPKLLREAMALPEYKAPAPEVTAPSLDDLRLLSEKLKKNGDNDSADLLQRFIAEHQRLMKQAERHVPDQMVNIQYKFFDVNLKDLRQESHLRDVVACSFNVVQAELSDLIATKKAKIVGEPAVRFRSNDVAELTEVVRLPADAGNADNVPPSEFRQFDLVIGISAKRIRPGHFQVESTTSLSEKAHGNAIALSDTTFPATDNPNLTKITVPINSSDTTFLAVGSSINGHKLFVLMTTTVRD